MEAFLKFPERDQARLPAVIAAGFFMAVGCGVADAASFDCAKAAAPVEKMICASPQVSALDEQLAALYGHAKGGSDAVRTSQREWLSHVRDKCGTTDCLVQAYTARIAELKSPAPACAVSTATLLGDWRNSSGEGFDELDFSADEGKQRFVSWVRHAPFAIGSWDLQKCSVHLQGDNDSISFELAVQGYEHGKLRLRDEDEGTTLLLEKSSPRK
jgi:uncharacterized protein